MNLDDNICYCYHVSLRKLVNFARREKLTRESQMSQCLGAGTGCGWCIPILKKIYHQVRTAQAPMVADDAAQPVAELPLTPEEYAEARRSYLSSSRKNSF